LFFKKLLDKTSLTDDGKAKQRQSGQRDLEMNHSHYLMLDDGRLRFYDIGDYRTRLCAQLAKLQHETEFPSKCDLSKMIETIFLLFLHARISKVCDQKSKKLYLFCYF
jgi:hypothetical protein